MTPDREQYVIVVRAEGHGPPVHHRLKRLLKAMLRGYGLRCVRIAPEQPPPPPPTDPPDAGSTPAFLGPDAKVKSMQPNNVIVIDDGEADLASVVTVPAGDGDADLDIGRWHDDGGPDVDPDAEGSR